MAFLKFLWHEVIRWAGSVIQSFFEVQLPLLVNKLHDDRAFIKEGDVLIG